MELPAVTPEAIPVADTIVATEVVLLDHVPAAVALLKDEVAPGQIAKVPFIAPGVIFTVAVFIA